MTTKTVLPVGSMSSSELALGLAVVVLALAGGCAWLWRRLNRLERRAADLDGRIEALQGDLQSLILAGGGMDQRLHGADVRWRDLQTRIQKLEGQLSSERAYREAIEMVRKGGDPRRLIKEFQLTEGEAQLISMLHGERAQAG